VMQGSKSPLQMMREAEGLFTWSFEFTFDRLVKIDNKSVFP
jgi:hypothetical protein